MHTGWLAVPQPCRLFALCQASFHCTPRHLHGVFHWLFAILALTSSSMCTALERVLFHQQFSDFCPFTVIIGSLYGSPGNNDIYKLTPVKPVTKTRIYFQLKVLSKTSVPDCKAVTSPKVSACCTLFVVYYRFS